MNETTSLSENPRRIVTTVFDRLSERYAEKVKGYQQREKLITDIVDISIALFGIGLIVAILGLLAGIFITKEEGGLNENWILIAGGVIEAVGLFGLLFVGLPMKVVFNPPTGYRNLSQGCLNVKQKLLEDFGRLGGKERITGQDYTDLDKFLIQLEKGVRACGSLSKCSHQDWWGGVEFSYSCEKLLRFSSEETEKIRYAFELLRREVRDREIDKEIGREEALLP